MQEYYNKKARECEAVVEQLQHKISQMKAGDAVSLQTQMAKVRREMGNYKAAVAAAEA